MSAPRRALLVMGKGPTRDAAAHVLAKVAADVVTATDPFEATARFAERPADLVIASLAGWRKSDLGFLSAVRARSAAAAVLVIVPDRHRELAAAALRIGADACLSEPLDLDELDAAARRLLQRVGGTEGPADSVGRLASQVGHAVNNPLQVMSLLLEEGAAIDAKSDPKTARLRDGLRVEVGRIRDAIEVVAAYGRLGKSSFVVVDLNALAAERVERWTRAGLVMSTAGSTSPAVPVASAHRADATPVRPVVEAAVDASQVRDAIDAIVRFLVAVSGRRPVPLSARARPSTSTARRGVEVAIRVEGLRLPAERLRVARSSVLEVDDATRVPFPGLALPDAVGRAHGGGVLWKESRTSTVLVLRLPGR